MVFGLGSSSMGAGSFFVGMANVVGTVWLLAGYPQHYFVYHLLKNTLHLLIRTRHFASMNWSYFMMEFCYIVNFASFAYIIVCVAKANLPWLSFLRPALDPLGPAIFRVGFTWSSGVLAASVAIFKNSLVLHDVNHMGILAVHVGPPLVMWTMRWYTDLFARDWPDTFNTGCEQTDCPGSLFGLVLLPTGLYLLCWCLPYFLVQFILDEEEIRESNQMTMYRYYQESLEGALFRHIFEAKTEKRVYKRRAAVYMLIHLGIFLACSLIAYAVFFSFVLHTAWLAGLCAVSVWNGGTYYFEVCMSKEKILNKASVEELRAVLEAKEAEARDEQERVDEDSRLKEQMRKLAQKKDW